MSEEQTMDGTYTEMSLEQYVGELPIDHYASRQYVELRTRAAAYPKKRVMWVLVGVVIMKFVSLLVSA